MKDHRLAVLAKLDRQSIAPEGTDHGRASARGAAEELRHELSLEGVDVPDVTSPSVDPFPVAALLRAAVAHARKDGRSQADIARTAGLSPEALSRALKDGSEARPSTVRAVLRVAGMRLVVAEDSATPARTQT